MYYKNMRTGILIWLCCAFLSQVFAVENEVKRGASPFMAIVYYPDEMVVDGTGARFLRGATLIRNDWLVTSGVGPSVTENTPNSFPQKTMLARLGAIAIDSNFTLNEDEDEQEREIIQIVRPYNSSATQWWRTDISLMKTLLPFNITAAVATTSLNFKADYIDKTCSILVYAKKVESVTEEKVLMQLSVEMLPPTMENCGSHFDGSTMACASDIDENKNVATNADFCRGNSGGPLICDGQVIGLQTYIENKCKQPHLYQLVSTWENFINCGIEDSCHKEDCLNTCDVVNKDASVTELPKNDNSSFVNDETVDSSVIISEALTVVTDNSEPEYSPTVSTLLTSANVVLVSNDSPIPTNIIILPNETSLHTEDDVVADVHYNTSTSWPNEKHKKQHTNLSYEGEEIVRKANVDAQYQHTDKIKIKARKAATRNICSVEIFIGIFVLAYLS